MQHEGQLLYRFMGFVRGVVGSLVVVGMVRWSLVTGVAGGWGYVAGRGKLDDFETCDFSLVMIITMVRIRISDY
jgi:hypothetical protein